MIPRVYLSGPISLGDRTHNFSQAARVQKRLMEEGFAVLNPMLSMMHPSAWEIPHTVWMQNDLPFVEVCHVVLRLPGESVGAGMECSWARSFGIPVFNTVDEVLEWKKSWNPTE